MSEKPVRVLILTADVGFGHRVTARAIASALQERYGDLCLVETANPLDDRRVPSFLRRVQHDYDGVVTKMPEVYRLNYEISRAQISIAAIESALTVIFFQVFRSLINKHQPAVVVTTYPFYMAPLNAYLTLRKLDVPYLTVSTDLTNLHRLWYSPGANLTFMPNQTAYEEFIEFGFPASRLQVTGIPINPAFVLEDRPAPVIRAELGWDPHMTTVLVVGSKRVKNLINTLHVLNHSGLPFQFILVAGGDDRLYAEFQATEWHKPVHIYNYVDRMPQFLRAADMVVSKAGGLIVTESLACGLPLMLVDVTPGQEEGNADYVVEKGAAERARNPVEALEILHHWLDRDQRLLIQRAGAARLLGLPNAAFDVADRVWEAASLGRLVPKTLLSEWRPKLEELLHSIDTPRDI